MKIPFLLCLVAMATGWTCCAGRVCERITVPLCTSGIGYNYTSMPNILNHTSQDEAGLEFHQFYPLVKVGCSSSLKKFLCSAYIPRCTQTGGVMPPCRSLCEEARRGCQPLMKKFGFPWPASLNCSTFPVEGGDISCIAPDVRSVSVTPTTDPTTRTTRTGKCEKVSVPLCKGRFYNYTMYPNVLNHSNQDEAARKIFKYYPLVISECSKVVRMFLCFLYVPACTVFKTAIPPCRSLCELSKKGCEPALKEFGLSWPDEFTCSKFPKSGNGHCAGARLSGNIVNPILTKVRGAFTSPNYPKPYPHGIKQDWVIQLPDSYKAVQITIKKMSLEEDRNCLYDYIIIKDKMLNQVGPRHCGTYRYPHQVPVRGNKAIITFVSDGSTSKAGFLIKYKGLRYV